MMIEYLFIAALLGLGVPLILFGPRVSRFFFALGVGFAWWRADLQMRAFIREREREAEQKAKADVARAALKAAGENKHAVDLVT